MSINFLEIMYDLYDNSGIKLLMNNPKNLIMIAISLIFMYLAIFKKYEPYLLLPIAFGMFIVNFPFVRGEGIMDEGGLLYNLYKGVKFGIFPPLIFMSIGASIDFGPLIANPKNFLLGAAAQIGIFVAFLIAIFLGFNVLEAASIGIIGGADGPIAIYLTSKLAPHQLGSIAIAAYSYMALIPVIQPPVIKLLTTKKERKIKMIQLREVSQREKIIFPIVVASLTILIIPSSATLIGMLMFGNLIKESGVVPQIVENVKNALLFIVTVFIGLTVGATATAESFLQLATIKIIILGLVAFIFGTVFGVLFGKLMCVLTRGKVNPMIGAAGVSAVPMAARVVHKMGLEEDSSNFLLMHAMGPNVSGVIGSAVAAGILFSIFG